MDNTHEAVENAALRNALVETTKGAKFTGHVYGWYYNPHMKHYGVVVVVVQGKFAGTTHVYPASQVEEVIE